MSRQWGIHEPNVETRVCAYCLKEFYPEHGANRFCPEHRSPKFYARARLGIHSDHTFICAGCGDHITVSTRKGRPRKFCNDCAKTKGEIGGSSTRVLTYSGSQSLFDADKEIASLSVYSDPVFARVEDEYLSAEQEVMRDLEYHEVVYAGSCTEHHQPAFSMLRLDIAIENVSEKHRQQEMYWAKIFVQKLHL